VLEVTDEISPEIDAAPEASDSWGSIRKKKGKKVKQATFDWD
jgi:hypothetical protein